MRKNWRAVGAAVAVAAIGLALIGAQTAQAQKKGKTRAAATKYLMKGINLPNCGGLAKILKDGPADDEAWEQVTLHASLINEMSYLLMDDGRCPSGDWKGACDTLRGCSTAVLAAAEKKDVEAARGAFAELTKACAACHKAHRK